MTINNLKLTNYRNHEKLELDFSNKINSIVGSNGTGKTNVLEAIYLLATTKSFRAKYDRNLIMYNKNFTNIKCQITNEEFDDILELSVIKSPRFENASSKKAKVNGTIKTVHNFAGTLNAVLFSPENLNIITGTPSIRRHYLNLVLTQVNEKYKKIFSDYTKVIKQRNKLLEKINETGKGQEQLNYWDDKAINLGNYIQKVRSDYFKFLGRSNNKENISFEYKLNSITQERMESKRSAEIATKNTLCGPHRDDFIILQEEKDMSQFGSRGQQRTAIFTLKILEMEYMEQELGHRPILLLDDIFSELDKEHSNLVYGLAKRQQTIITSTNLPDNINKDNIIKL